MYRPSMYNKHDESMYAFVELFNNCKVCNDVIMKPNDEETYGNDGYFIHSNGQTVKQFKQFYVLLIAPGNH